MTDGVNFRLRSAARLSREEERELIARLQRGDASAGALLIASHLRFVTHIAKRYRSYGQPLSDLVQEGTVGLMEALKRFNPERDVRLSTYAMWWIRASIQDYVVRSRSLVRIGTTAAQKALFFNLRRVAGALAEGEPVAEDFARTLAARFNTSVADVIALARRIARPDQSLEAPVGDGAEGVRLIDRVEDDRPSPEDLVLAQSEFRLWRERLVRALAALPPRELMIIKRRFLAERAPSRAALARELGLSKERVRQIEMRALARLRAVIEAAVGSAEKRASAAG
ncbi:MAG: sigma-70 family RNA polymerase sigma factor [Alphaproteobacteria bacterium]|nr:sigma-70 family RNA polymerase sigma factor [Alphaproteobacteria bacterium]